MPFVATAGVLELAASTLATSWTVTLTSGCAVGQTAVMVVGSHAAAGEDANYGATDSKGNTWSELCHVLQTGNVQMSVLWCKPTTALTSGDTVGINHGGVSTGSTSAIIRVYDDIQSFDQFQSAASASATAFSTGTTGSGAQAAQLAIGAFAWKVAAGTNDKTFSAGSGYTADTVRQSSVSSGTYRNTVMEDAYTSSVATRSASGTASSSAYAGAIVVFNVSTPAQSAAPVADVTTTGWTTTPGGSVWSCIDEASPSDLDYVTSPANPVNSVLEFKFGPLSVPSLLTGEVGRVRLRANNATSASAKIEIYCGATLIAVLAAAQTITPGAGFVTFPYSLTSTQASNITDYTDIRMRLTVNAS